MSFLFPLSLKLRYPVTRADPTRAASTTRVALDNSSVTFRIFFLSVLSEFTQSVFKYAFFSLGPGFLINITNNDVPHRKKIRQPPSLSDYILFFVVRDGELFALTGTDDKIFFIQLRGIHFERIIRPTGRAISSKTAATTKRIEILFRRGGARTSGARQRKVYPTRSRT